MRAALGFAEAGKLADAEMAFRLAVTRDAKFDRAWYNLGLLQAQQNRLPEAAESLAKAAALAPAVADYPYALATVRLRQGDRAAAKEAAQRALQAQPAHEGARQILRTLP
jgi:tetratricopeptide (TPR) repeat protein